MSCSQLNPEVGGDKSTETVLNRDVTETWEESSWVQSLVLKWYKHVRLTSSYRKYHNMSSLGKDRNQDIFFSCKNRPRFVACFFFSQTNRDQKLINLVLPPPAKIIKQLFVRSQLWMCEMWTCWQQHCSVWCVGHKLRRSDWHLKSTSTQTDGIYTRDSWLKPLLF